MTDDHFWDPERFAEAKAEAGGMSKNELKGKLTALNPEIPHDGTDAVLKERYIGAMMVQAALAHKLDDLSHLPDIKLHESDGEAIMSMHEEVREMHEKVVNLVKKRAGCDCEIVHITNNTTCGMRSIASENKFGQCFQAYKQKIGGARLACVKCNVTFCTYACATFHIQTGRGTAFKGKRLAQEEEEAEEAEPRYTEIDKSVSAHNGCVEAMEG